jgi:hypothetical protein
MRTKLDIYDFIQQSTEILSRKTTFLLSRKTMFLLSRKTTFLLSRKTTFLLSRKTTFYGHKTFEDKLCTVKPVLRGYRWDK